MLTAISIILPRFSIFFAVENIFDGTGLKFEDNHRLKPHTLKQRRQSLLF